MAHSHASTVSRLPTKQLQTPMARASNFSSKTIEQNLRPAANAEPVPSLKTAEKDQRTPDQYRRRSNIDSPRPADLSNAASHRHQPGKQPPPTGKNKKPDRFAPVGLFVYRYLSVSRPARRRTVITT